MQPQLGVTLGSQEQAGALRYGQPIAMPIAPPSIKARMMYTMGSLSNLASIENDEAGVLF